LIVNSLALFAEVIVAPHFEQATTLRKQAQAALDEAASTATALGRQLAIVKSISSQPGWFAWDETFDPGRAVSELMLKEASSVAEVAALVRSVFGGIDEISTLSDPVAFSLAPSALAAALWDPVRLERRIRSVLRVLRAATKRNAGWVADPPAFVAALLRGHSQLNEQIGILGFLARSTAPRKTMLMGAIGVYQKFSEGPLRRFGGLVLQAAEVAAGRQAELDTAALTEEKLGKTMEALERVSPVLTSDVSFLIRNADAHYEFEILDPDILVTEPRRKGKKRQERLTDDDFFELLFNLNELLVALEVALIAYISSEAPAILEELNRTASSRDDQLSVLKALAGLRGWIELSFEFATPALQIEGRYVGPHDTNPFLELLSTISAIFGVFPDIDSVEVTRRDSAGRLAYPRAIVGDRRAGPAGAIEAGRAIAYVMRSTDPEHRLEHDARNLLIGPVAVLVAAVGTLDLTMIELRALCVWLVDWLPAEDIDGALLADRDQLIRHLRTLADAIAVSQLAANSHDTRWQDRSSQGVRQALLALAKDRERLSTQYLPDQRPPSRQGAIVT
jgi:hypothetical protein